MEPSSNDPSRGSERLRQESQSTCPWTPEQKRWAKVSLFALFVALLTVILYIYRDDVFDALRTAGAWLRAAEAGGVLLMCGWAFLTSFPPVPLRDSGLKLTGYVWNSVLIGFAIAFLGSLCGSILCFLAGRYLFRARVSKWVEDDKYLAALRQSMAVGGLKLTILLRIGPFPFSWMSLFLSATDIDFKTYLGGTFIGLQWIWYQVWLGTNLDNVEAATNLDFSQTSTKVNIAVILVSAVLCILFMYWIKRIVDQIIAENARLKKEARAREGMVPLSSVTSTIPVDLSSSRRLTPPSHGHFTQSTDEYVITNSNLDSEKSGQKTKTDKIVEETKRTSESEDDEGSTQDLSRGLFMDADKSLVHSSSNPPEPEVRKESPKDVKDNSLRKKSETARDEATQWKKETPRNERYDARDEIIYRKKSDTSREAQWRKSDSTREEWKKETGRDEPPRKKSETAREDPSRKKSEGSRGDDQRKKSEVARDDTSQRKKSEQARPDDRSYFEERRARASTAERETRGDDRVFDQKPDRRPTGSVDRETRGDDRAFDQKPDRRATGSVDRENRGDDRAFDQKPDRRATGSLDREEAKTRVEERAVPLNDEPRRTRSSTVEREEVKRKPTPSPRGKSRPNDFRVAPFGEVDDSERTSSESVL